MAAPAAARARLRTASAEGGDVRQPDRVPAARGRATNAVERLLEPLWRWLATYHLHQGPHELAVSVTAAALLALGALAGVGWIAGYGELAPLLKAASPVWYGIAFGAEILAYVGYTLAYRELARVDRGRSLGLPRVFAVVASGFGLFIPRGGFTADYHALVDTGFRPREARLRVLGMGALEYAILAPGAAIAAILLLVHGAHVPPSFTIPWAVAVPAGFAVAFALLGRRERWHRAGGWRGWLAHALDVVALLRRLVQEPRAHGFAAGAGMALYWAADITCLWACLYAVLGHSPPLAALLIGYATGYALTRRSLPFAGAGAVEVLVPFTLHWVGIPLAPAVLGVFAYRIFNLWLPLLPALVGRRHMLREVA